MAQARNLTCREASRLITPYIRKEIKTREAEAFVNHIRTCPDCYDDLEMNLLVHNALDVLDNDRATDDFDIEKKLKEDLDRTELRIRKGKKRNRRMFILILFVELLLILLAVNAFLPAVGDVIHRAGEAFITFLTGLFT